jgi:hypothetical protein
MQNRIIHERSCEFGENYKIGCTRIYQHLGRRCLLAWSGKSRAHHECPKHRTFWRSSALNSVRLTSFAGTTPTGSIAKMSQPGESRLQACKLDLEVGSLVPIRQHTIHIYYMHNDANYIR